MSEHGKRWLPDQDAFLLLHIDQEDEILAHILQRTPHAVACRRIRLATKSFKEAQPSHTTFSEYLQNFHANPELAERIEGRLFKRGAEANNLVLAPLATNTIISLDDLERMATLIMQDLGGGYSESIYQHALFNKIVKMDPTARMEVSMPVVYDNEILGICRADVVTREYVIEIKAVRSLRSSFQQIRNQIRKYLRHIGLAEGGGEKDGIVINFNQENERLEFLPIKP
jgi:GxxExxY protein